MNVATNLPPTAEHLADLDQAVSELQQHKRGWARTSPEERVAILERIKDGVMAAAEAWVTTASRSKGIPVGSPLEGEEWLSGPYAVLAACNQLIHTLSNIEGKKHIDGLKLRELANGQLSARVGPESVWESLLLSGVTAELWMLPDVTAGNLKEHTARPYDVPVAEREGEVVLILGAGNIAAIPPLDCFHRIFSEHQVAILKMNPVNDYLTPFLEQGLAPLIEAGALRIVKGGADVGAHLCQHEGIESIHITGSQGSHDAIVWGVGEEGETNRAANTPRNPRPITSELGAVCPTIVVPGPWTAADIQFQAEQIATQKLHNSGFNCIACQMLILPEGWDGTDKLMTALEETIRSAPSRPLYYPGAEDRLADFEAHSDKVLHFARDNAPACAVVPFEAGDDGWLEINEVFTTALTTYRLPGDDAEAYLRSAIAYANDKLRGTLGANVLIHPATIKAIGKKRFEELMLELRYGCIAINTWTGLGFLMTQCAWGAFPGHTLQDVQSGIGFVHNTYMFDSVQRTVVTAPFRPFPRTALSGGMTMLPRPPWFVTNRKAKEVGEKLTRFQYRPGWGKLPGVFFYALQG